MKLGARRKDHIAKAKSANAVQKWHPTNKSRSKFVLVVIICDGLNIGGVSGTERSGELSRWVQQLLLFLVAELGMLSKIQVSRKFQLYVVKISTMI